MSERERERRERERERKRERRDCEPEIYLQGQVKLILWGNAG